MSYLPSPLHLGTACALGVLLMGCGPHMVPHVRDVRAFASAEPCAQGPFEIHQQTHGERYRETYAFVIYSPRAIRGHYQAIYDGEVMREGEFGGQREIMERTDNRDYPYRRVMLTEDEADNERCLVSSPSSGGAAPAAGGSQGGAAPNPLAPGGDVTSRSAPSAATPSLDPVPWPHPRARLYGPDVVAGHLGRIEVDDWSWLAPLDGGAATEPGVDFTIRIWSDLPNDLEGVIFLVEHGYWQPNVSDEEWAAHEEAQARSDARRRGRRQRRAARRHARRQAHCAEHHESESCWGPGGYEGAVARANAPRTSRPSRAAAVVAPAEPAAAEPGPPPSPRAETQPPKPSQNARWIPGYWRWGGQAWVWLGGMWDVPETDVEAGLTASAPSLPPPPRQVARPALPAPGLVWIAGYWQWSGSAWVWVTGRWQAPPQGAGGYRAPRWQARGAGAVFVPGGFSLRVRVGR